MATGDLDCDRDVGLAGLSDGDPTLAVLLNITALFCPADFDGDGDTNVGTSDLLALLVNWGPCR